MIRKSELKGAILMKSDVVYFVNEANKKKHLINAPQKRKLRYDVTLQALGFSIRPGLVEFTNLFVT